MICLGASLSACQSQIPRFPDALRQGPINIFQASARNMQVYVGNLHSHTGYSDGILTPREAYRMGEGNGLDFLAVTEHNHSSAGGSDGIHLTPALYEDLKKAAAEATKPGKFAALYGQEFSTISSGNHMNVFEANEIIRVPNGDFKQLYEKWLPAHKEVPFVQMNHPGVERDLGLIKDEFSSFDAQEAAAHAHEEIDTNDSKLFNDYGYDDYGRNFKAMAQAANPYVKTIEIINGPGTNPKPVTKAEARHEKDYFYYLNEGFKLAPTADQDNHFAHWGSLSPARTGILATELTKASVYDAIRRQRIFASEDNNLSLTLQANDHWMGETIAAPAALAIEITVTDADEPQAAHMVQLFADLPGGALPQPVAQQNLATGQTVLKLDLPAQPPGTYFFAKVTQFNTNGTTDKAWTAPIWLQ